LKIQRISGQLSILKKLSRVSVMGQLSKIIKSRDSWRDKAVRRAEILRDSRKAKKRHQMMITELKTENKKLQEALEEQKKR
jgi:hypothetical protein